MAGNPVELPKFCFKTGTIQDCPGHGEHAYTVPARVREGERERERQRDRQTDRQATLPLLTRQRQSQRVNEAKEVHETHHFVLCMPLAPTARMQEQTGNILKLPRAPFLIIEGIFGLQSQIPRRLRGCIPFQGACADDCRVFLYELSATEHQS